MISFLEINQQYLSRINLFAIGSAQSVGLVYLGQIGAFIMIKRINIELLVLKVKV